MAVTSYREILPRTYEHRLGDSPSASRVVVATVDEPTPTATVLAAIGIVHGQSHPEFNYLICLGYTVDETDRHHVTVSYSYGIPDKDKTDPDNPENPPWLQPDTWSFSTSNASVACETYYFGAGNNFLLPLANTAGDKIFGIAKAEAELKISISGARLQLDLQQVKRYVNTINDNVWAGFPRHTVQCVGVSASPAKLEWEGQVLNYWQITVELIYRSSSHNLKLANVGWNVIVNGKKQRAWVYIEEGGERMKVASPHPVALNRAGGFLCGQDQDGNANNDGDTTVPDDQSMYYG